MATMFNRPDSGYLGKTPEKTIQKFVLENDTVHEIHSVLVHKFSMSDVEDPELYAAIPLREFMDTPKGQWIKENCADPIYTTRFDQNTYGYEVVIYGKVSELSATEYYLRWS